MNTSFLKKSLDRFYKSIKDSTITFISTLLLFILLSVDATIAGKMRGFEVISDYIYSGIYALLVSTFVSIVISSYIKYKGNICSKKENKVTLLITAISFVVWFILSILSLSFGYSNYVEIALLGTLMILICFECIILNKRKQDGNINLYIIRSLFIAFLVSTIVFVGLEICYTAFEFLIYDSTIGSMYKIIMYFAYILVFINIFVSYIPKKDQEINVQESFESLITKVFLSIYLILIGILYIYIVKIVVTQNVPSGTMNWYASLAMLGFVFLYLVIPMKNKLCRYYKNYSGILMIPILFTQLILIYIRISAYGFTTLRLLSILFIICGSLFILNTFIKKDLKYILITCCIIMFIGCISPFNVQTIAKYSQESRMISILEKYDRYKDEKIIKSNAKIDESDVLKLSSCYTYLKECEGKGNTNINLIRKYSFKDIFGIDYISEKAKESYNDEIAVEYSNSEDLNMFNIKKYSSMFVLDYNNESSNPCNLKVKNKNNQNIVIDMNSDIEKITEEYGTKGADNIKMEYDYKNIKIILTNLYITYDNSGKIKAVEYKGFEFIK